MEWQIVGVYRNIRNGGPRDDGFPEIDVPLAQSPWPDVDMAVRTAGDPASLSRAASPTRFKSVDPDLPMVGVRTMEQIVDLSIAGDRFRTVLFGSFGAVALLLAALGIYGVMSFLVAQRTPEIGLRMALGAERRGVVAQVLKEGMLAAGDRRRARAGRRLLGRPRDAGHVVRRRRDRPARLWRGRAGAHRLRAPGLRDPGQARRVRRSADGAAKRLVPQITQTTRIGSYFLTFAARLFNHRFIVARESPRSTVTT